MSILERTRTSSSHPASRQSPVQASGVTGMQLLEAADAAYSIAEQNFDRMFSSSLAWSDG